MIKDLVLGGRGRSIVVGSFVRNKESGEMGLVLKIRFRARGVASRYQVKWNEDLTDWVDPKEVSLSL